MTLLQEILNWSNGLPPWQSDAVARLLLRGSLSSEDEADLFALLKLSQGIPDPGGRIPKPLTEAQIPHPAEGSTEIKLLAIKNNCKQPAAFVYTCRINRDLRRQWIRKVRIFESLETSLPST
jgi:hypothetical protein